MSKDIPTYKPVAWISLVPQLIAMGTLVGLAKVGAGMDWNDALIVGAIVYLFYSWGVKSTLTHHHKTGIERAHAGDFADAIHRFEQSYTFFSEHPWIDRWRYAVLLSSNQCSYREMALVNIAFCYVQLGRREDALHYYQRALEQFPNSTLAQAGFSGLQQTAD